MTTLREIKTAFNRINSAYEALSHAMSTPPESTVFNAHDVAYYHGEISKAAKKLGATLEKFNLPHDTVYHLNTEIEFAVWVQSQQA